RRGGELARLVGEVLAQQSAPGRAVESRAIERDAARPHLLGEVEILGADLAELTDRDPERSHVLRRLPHPLCSQCFVDQSWCKFIKFKRQRSDFWNRDPVLP